MIKIFAFLLLSLTACTRAEMQPEFPVAQLKPTAKLSWEINHPERAFWSDALMNQITLNFDSFAKAKDSKFFMPNFESLSRNEKIRIWAEIMVWLAYYESSWNPLSYSIDVGSPKDKDTWSVGLYQLSVVDGPIKKLGYSFKDLQDPIKNITGGVAIFVRQFNKYGVWLIFGGPSQGLYFATLHPGGKYDKSEAIKQRVQSSSDITQAL